MKKYVILVILPVIMLAACEKEDNDDINNQDQNDNPEKYDDYYPLAVDNYWVYDKEEIDMDGNIIGNAGRDCVIVVSDSLIEGELYHKIHTYKMSNGNYTLVPGWKYLRDSLDCLIDCSGTIQFSYAQINDTIAKEIQLLPNGADTMFAIHVVMKEHGPAVTVPAGTYDVLDARHLNYSDYYPQTVNQPVVNNYFYAKDVGLVMFISNKNYPTGNRLSHSLVSYSLNGGM